MSKKSDPGQASPDVGRSHGPNVPTLPGLPSIPHGGDRSALVGGVAFVEGVARSWSERDLISWFQEHLVIPHRMAPPVAVSDAVVGTIALRVSGESPASSARRTRLEDLPKLLAMSRSRVVVTLRGFIATPSDDRFLQAAIFAERVKREAKPNAAGWVAQPRAADLLSNIVLSLFSADILMYREFHEQNLCVCDVCGRVSFAPEATSRSGCNEHLPRSEQKSGFTRRGE